MITPLPSLFIAQQLPHNTMISVTLICDDAGAVLVKSQRRLGRLIGFNRLFVSFWCYSGAGARRHSGGNKKLEGKTIALRHRWGGAHAAENA